MSPYVLDMQGNDLSTVVIGQPVTLQIEVLNTRAESRSGMAIFEVRDWDGFTVYLGWQGVTVGPNGKSVISQSWLPPRTGEFLFRTFAISSIENPATLTMIHEAPSLAVLSSPTSEPPIPLEDDAKTFIIGYKMVIPSENMNMVSVNDFPWMADMIENGEVLVSANDGKRFIRSAGDSPDFEITMEDGTVVYYNINYSDSFLIPKTPYVKAWGPVEVPEGEQVLDLDAGDIPSLRNAVEDYLRWVEVRGTTDDRALSELIENDIKYFKFLEDDGTTVYYQIRYISSSQERIN